MSFKKILTLQFILMFIVSLTFAEVAVYAQPQTGVSIDPSLVIVDSTQPIPDFSVSLKVTDVTDLYAWEAWIYFDPSQVNAIGAQEGPFLQSVGPTIWNPPEINNTAGTIHMGASLIIPQPGANGEGVLAYLDFKCIAAGSSILQPDVALWDSLFNPISHTVQPGTVVQTDMFWKRGYPDYAPSGVPDFDQRQYNWSNPTTGKWTYCGPTAAANSLWWMDSRFEPNNVPPPNMSDGYPLVQSYNATWDDHDPKNVRPLIDELAWYVDTDGIRTGIAHNGTTVRDMQLGIDSYIKDKGLSSQLYEKTIYEPTFEEVEFQVERSEDVLLLLGFWQFDPANPEKPCWRIGGHWVTVAGVDSQNKLVSWSDPILDNAEPAPRGAGGPGRVLPAPPHPAHAAPTPNSLHNNASFVSHDTYKAQNISIPCIDGVWGPEYYDDPVVIDNFIGQNGDVTGDFNPNLGVITSVEVAVIVSPFFWKARYDDYAPSGVPDFDQRQWGAVNWTNPISGTWSWCVPVSVANSLWWLDSEFETGNVPPPTISDSFALVQSYNLSVWDDHDPRNVQPFIEHLAWLMDTDGQRTGLAHFGTTPKDAEAGIAQYISWTGLNPLGDANGDGIVDVKDKAIVGNAMGSTPGAANWDLAADLDGNNKVDSKDADLVSSNFGKIGKFIEKTVKAPEFEYIEKEIMRSEDVILFIGFYQGWPYEDPPYWRIGGHAVTAAGVDSENWMIALSDPALDNAEPPPDGNGGLGQVLPPPPHNHTGPPETLHNNATYVSHDVYFATNMTGGPPPLPPNTPGGVWGLVGYGQNATWVQNYIGQNTPEDLANLTGPYNPGLPIYNEVEYAVIISHRGPTVAAGASDGFVYAFDPEGSQMWNYSTGAAVASVAMSVDGSYIAAGSVGNGLYLFDPVGNKLWNVTIPISKSWTGWAGTESKSVSISADGKYIAAATTNGTYLYRNDGTLVFHYGNASLKSTIVQISANGMFLAAGDYNSGKLHYLANPDFGLPVSNPVWNKTIGTKWVAIDALGQYIAVSSYFTVELYDRNGTQIWQYQLPRPGHTRVDISWDGRTVVQVNDDPTDATGAELNYFNDTKDGSSGWNSTDGVPVWTFRPDDDKPAYDFYTVDTDKWGKVVSTGGVPTSIYSLAKDGSLMNNVTDPARTIQSVDLTFLGDYGAAGTGNVVPGNNGFVWLYSTSIGAIWSYNVSAVVHSVAVSELYPCMFPFPNHDLAIVNVTADKFSVAPGTIVNINVTVANEGDFSESFFDVYVEIFKPTPDFLYQPQPDFVKVQSLANGTSTNLAFTWNTTNVSEGNYTLTAKVVPVQDEIDIYDNMFINGIVEVVEIHDIAVTNLTSCYGSTIVAQNGTYTVNVTVTNEGNMPETFNLTLYWNTTNVIASTNVSLAVNETKVVQLDWNTTGYQRYASYILSAYATPVPGETDTADNTYVDPRTIIITYSGDITGPTPGVPDGKVDIRDIATIAKLFGVNYPNPKYDPNCDLNCDGKIDIKDIATAAKNFGYVEP